MERYRAPIKCSYLEVKQSTTREREAPVGPDRLAGRWDRWGTERCSGRQWIEVVSRGTGSSWLRSAGKQGGAAEGGHSQQGNKLVQQKAAAGGGQQEAGFAWLLVRVIIYDGTIWRALGLGLVLFVVMCWCCLHNVLLW